MEPKYCTFAWVFKLQNQRILGAKLGVSKKIKKLIKSKKPEKNNWKNWTEKKPIKILKKLAGSVRFSFINKKLKKPNRTKTGKNRKKPSQTGKTEPNRAQTGKNRAKPVGTGFCTKKKNRTEPNRNWSVWPDFSLVLVFFFKNLI